eukprot:3103588-Rhodomonas_salina.1
MAPAEILSVIEDSCFDDAGISALGRLPWLVSEGCDSSNSSGLTFMLIGRTNTSLTPGLASI